MQRTDATNGCKSVISLEQMRSFSASYYKMRLNSIEDLLLCSIPNYSGPAYKGESMANSCCLLKPIVPTRSGIQQSSGHLPPRPRRADWAAFNTCFQIRQWALMH